MATATEQRRSRRLRHEETRAEIVRAAIGLAGDAPFKDLSVDEIARAAGVSRPAFYTYFADKAELLLGAVEEVSKALYEQADTWWHGEGEPAELVRGAVGGIAEIYARNASLLRVAVEVSTYDDEVREFWLALTAQFIDATASHIRADQERGLIRGDIDPEGTAESLVWMTERCCYIYLGRGERRPEQVTGALIPVWVGALYS
jgi:AcrR family transcriptional regulator